MTISAQTVRAGPYSGDGATVAFAYGFLIDDEDELVVVLADTAGAETVQTITTHYTVSGVGNNSGGTVTMVTAPASGEKLSIRRLTVKDQGVDLQNRGAVYPQTLEDTFDEIVKMAQDLQEQIDRAILIAVTSNTTGINVPAPVADKFLGWNAAGTDLENKTPNTGDFVGVPGSSTDNAVVRFNGTGGATFQDSGVTISDADVVSAAGFKGTGGSSVTDLIFTTPAFLIDIDPGAAVASSYFELDIDNAQRMIIDGDGAVIGTGAADRTLRLTGTDAIRVPVGTTAQRPGTPEAGDVRLNTTTGLYEGHDGSNWQTFGAGVDAIYVSADDTTPGDLEAKLVVGASLSLSTNNPAGNETRQIDLAFASQAEAEAGTATDKALNALRTRQAIIEATEPVLLGTLNPSSGTTASLSSLDLTPYRKLRIFMDGISSNAGGTDYLKLNGVRLAGTTNAAAVLTGVGILDFLDSIQVGLWDRQGTNSDGSIIIHAITTATTTLTFTWNGGASFDATGTPVIKVYGVL